MKIFWIAGWCALTVLLSVAPRDADAQRRVYRFIDDRGVVHFTNVAPSDRRYHTVEISPQGFRPQSDLSARPPIHYGYDRIIARAALVYQLQPALVKAVIAAESNFEPTAVSRKGALGLMQLMPETARSLGVEEPMRPEENVLGGTRYLSEMLERYGDVTRALAAYNAGPTAVDRYETVPPYAETRAYVARVLNYYRRYNGDFRQ